MPGGILRSAQTDFFVTSCGRALFEKRKSGAFFIMPEGNRSHVQGRLSRCVRSAPMGHSPLISDRRCLKCLPGMERASSGIAFCPVDGHAEGKITKAGRRYCKAASGRAGENPH